MKLYATVTNEKGKRESKAGNEWLEVELTSKNGVIGYIRLTALEGDDWQIEYLRGARGQQSWVVDSCISPKSLSMLQPKAQD